MHRVETSVVSYCSEKDDIYWTAKETGRRMTRSQQSSVKVCPRVWQLWKCCNFFRCVRVFHSIKVFIEAPYNCINHARITEIQPTANIPSLCSSPGLDFNECVNVCVCPVKKLTHFLPRRAASSSMALANVLSLRMNTQWPLWRVHGKKRSHFVSKWDIHFNKCSSNWLIH